MTPSNRHILIVEDDEAIRQMVATIVGTIADARVSATGAGGDALATAIADPPAVMIVDVGLPDIDGYALCEAVRAREELLGTHFVFLTARGESHDRYQGFLAGADDYVIKPFDPLELQLRLKAHFRQRARAEGGGPTHETLVVGAVTLTPGRSTITVGGTEIALTGSEFAIIRRLATSPDAYVAVEDLLAEALDYPRGVGMPHVVHTHVKNLRGKVRARGFEPTFLYSNRKGYMLLSRQAAAEGAGAPPGAPPPAR